jgi:murein DD-endopeptidase MepM/ murein hydrolase activator NlpD
MRALAVIVLIVAGAVPSSTSASAATPPFLSLPVDGNPFIPYYVYDPWTLRMGLPTYSNITLGVPYDHSGTDYSVPQGSPVYAAATGVILSAQDGFADGCNKNLGDGGGAGNNIWIRHPNGFVTAYYHLQSGSVTQFVHQGQSVQAGQQIARSSNTGNTFGGTCGGFHLHFEVRDATYRVANPYNTDTGYLFVTDPPTRACLTPPAATVAPSTNVEQRIADFWARLDALQPGDCVSAADLGQWALNVIARNPRARTTVTDFRASTAVMQGGIDRAGLAPATPTATPAPTANVEQRIADFWKRIDALQPGDYVAAADLGQWALNVTDRNPRARMSVADFRSSTAAMQGGMDRAGVSP